MGNNVPGCFIDTTRDGVSNIVGKGIVKGDSRPAGVLLPNKLGLMGMNNCYLATRGVLECDGLRQR